MKEVTICIEYSTRN